MVLSCKYRFSRLLIWGLCGFRREELVKENDVYFCVPEGRLIKIIGDIGCKFVPRTFMTLNGTNLV